MRIRHKKVATLPDRPGVEVNKNEWNEDHRAYYNITTVNTTTYEIAEEDDIVLARVGPSPEGANAAITIDIGVDLDTWPLNVAKRFYDFDRLAETNNITIDAGPGKLIHSAEEDAQTHKLMYNGQSFTLVRITANLFMVY